MRYALPLLTLAAVLITVMSLTAAPDTAVASPEDPDAIAAMEGGDPIPEGAQNILFPWIGKQSVQCIGESVERQIAFVDFTNDAIQDAFGTVVIDAEGNATASFSAPVTELRTGHADRDEKVQGASWLDGESHPTLAFEATSMERIRPTVWRVKGTWTMRGVTKPVDFLANVRYIPEMRNVGQHIARVKASFEVDLQAYGVGGEWAGTPAVAGTWRVDLVALGVITGR
ncbi:MAG: YceI family protein [Planctomycetota bacterium]|jgi:polyisoprenoid-binding protein YceI